MSTHYFDRQELEELKFPNQAIHHHGTRSEIGLKYKNQNLITSNQERGSSQALSSSVQSDESETVVYVDPNEKFYSSRSRVLYQV